MATISPSDLEKAYTYGAYRALVEKLLAEGKATGTNHSESYLHYSKLNVARMRRLDKTATLLPSLEGLLSKVPAMTWVVISEGWCGDAAQNLPVMNQLAEASHGKITLHILLRDENLPIMDRHLTNGGRSIPKLIMLDKETGKELGTWGPRPTPVQAIVLEHKKNPKSEYAEVAEEVQKWYAKDRTQTLQHELTQLLQAVAEEATKA